MLKQRIVTAVILLIFFFLVIFLFSKEHFQLVTAIITLLAAWEWSNLLNRDKKNIYILYVLIVALVLSATIFIPYIYLFSIAFLWWLCAFIFILIHPKGTRWFQGNIMLRATMGLLTLVPSWAALNFIRFSNDSGLYNLLFMLFLIWGADTSAYFIGKKWGKRKLFPSISPNKTIAGFIAGFIFAIVFSWLVFLAIQFPYSLWFRGTFIAILTVFFAMVGDLFESLLKRQVDVKDSGKLLPGHGGILDRIDSITAAAPIYALFCLSFKF